MMKQGGMRPQDVVILLKKITAQGCQQTNKELALSVGISQSEVSAAIERCRVSKLVSNDKSRVNVLALRDFLMSGLQYVFPVQPGSIVRGMATAVSAPPISEHIPSTTETYVWPYKNGTSRGQGVIPLYKSVPKAAENDPELYRLLVIADTLRMGRVRERNVAIQELDKYIEAYGAR